MFIRGYSSCLCVHKTHCMNPIDTLFQSLRAAKRKAFMPFITAGDPDIAFTRELIPAVAESGANLIEVGFPFSDPIADGPVIQASYTRALEMKLKLDDIFSTLGSIKPSIPLVAMASYSLMYKRGVSAFIDSAKAAGMSGAVVPDVPVEEAEELSKLAADRDFKMILLVTPTTSPERAAKVVKACSGFVYVVSVVGITGERAKMAAGVPELLTRLRTMTDLPLCVGFGVSKPEHVRDLKEIADGVIVGSALVKKLEAAGKDRVAALADVRKLVRELSGALD